MPIDNAYCLLTPSLPLHLKVQYYQQCLAKQRMFIRLQVAAVLLQYTAIEIAGVPRVVVEADKAENKLAVICLVEAVLYT